MKCNLVVLGLVIFGLVVIGLLYKNKEPFLAYTTSPYPSACEFNRDCLWDTARWVQLSNGMEGVCTLNGIACPAFSKDHNEAINAGMSPLQIDDRYAAGKSGFIPYKTGWGANPPLINHYQDGRYRASDVWQGSGVVAVIEPIPDYKKELKEVLEGREGYEMNTAMWLGGFS